MPRVTNAEVFLVKARKAHGDKYDYSKVVYVRAADKVIIICLEHGEFLQAPSNHCRGRGCPACGAIKMKITKGGSLEKFLERATERHGDRYDYSKVVYVSSYSKVSIICPIHGEFLQTPHIHHRGSGCPKCADKLVGQKSTKSQDQFLTRAREAHGDRYDYSKAIYVNSTKKVVITCREHGDFLQLPGSHNQGVGCPECGLVKVGDNNRGSLEEFLERATKRHGDRYDYSKVIYVRAVEPVVIVCKDHGEFKQSPCTHHKGSGCPKCANELISRKYTKSQGRFLKEAKRIHGERYDYSKVEYIGTFDKVIVTCKLHGEFFQSPGSHLSGRGCPTCGDLVTNRKTRKVARDRFIPKSIDIHKGKYDYSLVNYTNYNDKVKIICPTHGVFEQNPGHHLQGCGCPTCGGHLSRREDDIAEFLKSWFKVEQRNRKVLDGKELDIYLPEKKFAVEYNGSYFHSDKFLDDPKSHLFRKKALCEERGIRLVHVADYEDQVVIKKTLAFILGLTGERYFARKCSVGIGRSTDKEIRYFFAANHLQGNATGCTTIYLKHNDSMVSAMSFSKQSSERGQKTPGRWELRRMASAAQVVGGASKMLKNFTRTYDCSSIVSYSDNRWFTGNMYDKLGFKFIQDVPPNYKYIKGRDIQPKTRFKRAVMAKRDDIDFRPEESERENALRNGWNRVFDCGKKKWELQV